MKKTVQFKQLIEFYHGLKQVSKLESPNFKFTFAVAKNMAKVSAEVEPILTSISSTNDELIKKYCSKNEAGIPIQNDKGFTIPPENQPVFLVESQKLNQEVDMTLGSEVEIDIHVVPAAEHIFPLNMKPEVMKAILLMVEDEDGTAGTGN